MSAKAGAYVSQLLWVPVCYVICAYADLYCVCGCSGKVWESAFFKFCRENHEDVPRSFKLHVLGSRGSRPKGTAAQAEAGKRESRGQVSRYQLRHLDICLCFVMAMLILV
eukprot:COSAG01_NODE_204_length_22090_cov_64.189441_18_plen_110_part_00